MTRKQIVTGAAGFIGSTLSQRLLDRGDAVVGVDCLTDYYAAEIKRDNLAPLLAHPRFTFIEKPILAVDWPAILQGAQAVYHLAAQAGVRASWGKSFEVYTELNILSTQVLLEALKGTGVRCVYASSSSVYGDTDLLPMKEEHRVQPLSPYGVTKLAAENLCVLYWQNFGVPTSSLRFFTVYGPKQRPDMAFHRFIKAALRGEPISLYGDGGQTRDFTFVDDIVRACMLSAEKAPGGAVYNVGGGSRISMSEVIAKLEGALNRKIAVDRQGKQKGDMRHTYADTSLIRAELGFAPEIALDQGLALEAQWIEERMALLV